MTPTDVFISILIFFFQLSERAPPWPKTVLSSTTLFNLLFNSYMFLNYECYNCDTMLSWKPPQVFRQDFKVK